MQGKGKSQTKGGGRREEEKGDEYEGGEGRMSMDEIRTDQSEECLVREVEGSVGRDSAVKPSC